MKTTLKVRRTISVRDIVTEEQLEREFEAIRNVFKTLKEEEKPLRIEWGTKQAFESKDTAEEAKRKFIILRRVFALWKDGKYNDAELLHFLAGWCHYAPQGEDVTLLETLATATRG